MREVTWVGNYKEERGYFHRFVVLGEDRVLYAVVECDDGTIRIVSVHSIKFSIPYGEIKFYPTLS